MQFLWTVSASHRVRTWVLACGVALVAGCGGGVYVSWGSGGAPPGVALTVQPTTAAVGQTVTLVAAASDDVGIDEVAFYRVDGGNHVLLHAYGPSGGYTLDTVIPPQAAGVGARYFVRATDVTGLRSDSDVVMVAVP